VINPVHYKPIMFFIVTRFHSFSRNNYCIIYLQYLFSLNKGNNLYYKSKSRFFVKHKNPHRSRIVIKFFTVIPDSLLEVLVPVLSGNISNILKFSDLYRNMLFVSKHTIWRENDTCLRVPI